MDDVAQIARHRAELVAAWSSARHGVHALAKEHYASSYAMCFEVCKRTWTEKKMIRVHMHVLLRRGDARIRVRSMESLRLLGSQPFATHEDLTRSKRASNFQAQYYCVAPKIGQVFSHSTAAAYLDFPVNADWVWSLLQAEKMSLDAAEAEFIKVVKNLPRHLSHLQELRKVHEEKRLQEVIERKELKFRKHRCAFKKIPKVVAFQAAFRTDQSRRKFLVLDGPSRMGKTEFVRSMVEPVAILELNCASCVDPPLADFNAGKHKLVLMDEGTVEMVLRNRKLFQCPNARVQLGTSATNCFSYSVYLNDCMLVVCSNSWAVQLSRTPLEGAKWIEANQIYVHVSEPLWVKPQGGS